MSAINVAQCSNPSSSVDLRVDASTFSSQTSALSTDQVSGRVLKGTSDHNAISRPSPVVKPVKGCRRHSGQQVVSWTPSQITRTQHVDLNTQPSHTADFESE